MAKGSKTVEEEPEEQSPEAIDNAFRTASEGETPLISGIVLPGQDTPPDPTPMGGGVTVTEDLDVEEPEPVTSDEHETEAADK